jgi:hypothetical protein
VCSEMFFGLKTVEQYFHENEKAEYKVAKFKIRELIYVKILWRVKEFLNLW